MRNGIRNDCLNIGATGVDVKGLCVVHYAVGLDWTSKWKMSPKSKRVLPGKRYPLNMRTTKELRDKIEWAAMASGRSLVQEVEFRLERSFQQEEIEKEIKRTLDARVDAVRDEIFKKIKQEMGPLVKAIGVTEEELAKQANKPGLRDLARYQPEPPEDTSEQATTDKREDSK
jgi:hypothetical protein